MKYHVKNKMLMFSSDEEVSRFHDQLTSAMRNLMLNVGSDGHSSHDEDARLTREFFDQYSALAETLQQLRSHMAREMET